MRQVVLLARPLPLPSAGRLAGSPARKQARGGAGWDDREDRSGCRLTAAVEATGKSPQYIVDEALAEHLARLGF
jgi:hypothetical protein